MHDPNIRMKAFEAARELMLHYHHLGAGTVADRLTDLLLTSRSIEAYLDGSDSFAGAPAESPAESMPDRLEFETTPAGSSAPNGTNGIADLAHLEGKDVAVGEVFSVQPKKPRTQKAKKKAKANGRSKREVAPAPSHESGNPVPETGSPIPVESGQDLPQAA